MSISLNDFNASPGNIAMQIDVGGRVKLLREKAGYSIDDLSVTCGLSNDEIESIEEGGDSDPARLKRIASALQVPLSAVLSANA
jgi:transcriptional regulator with XRE-family HTH domain